MSTAAIALRDILPLGRLLNRPECVLPSPDGDVYVPDWRGGISVVRADGPVHTWLAKGLGFELRPDA
jgi:hypothetical protein